MIFLKFKYKKGFFTFIDEINNKFRKMKWRNTYAKSSTPYILVGQAMIFRFFTLLIGFGLAVSGGVSIIAYLNYITAGYTFVYYLKFIALRVEFHLFLVGFLMIVISIYTPFSRR